MRKHTRKLCTVRNHELETQERKTTHVSTAQQLLELNLSFNPELPAAQVERETQSV